MVGPGTGLAPFRGFCQERAARKAGAEVLGPALLFTGFRNADEALFVDELRAWEASGVLTRQYTAISQPPNGEKGRYVQNDLWQHRVDVVAALKEGGYFYICGDASRMARGVDKMMCDIAVEQGLASDENVATEWLAGLQRAGRYRKDVYEQP